MLVRHLSELIGTERDVDWGNGQSRRVLVEADGMGFAVTDTTVNAGSVSTMQYVNHLMSAHVISGTGSLKDASGRSFDLSPGSTYALDQHDKYTLRAITEMRVLCVFNPPIEGHEKHDLNRREGSSY